MISWLKATGLHWALYAFIAGILIGGYGVHRIHSNLDAAAESQAYEEVAAALVKKDEELRQFERRFLDEQRSRQLAERAFQTALADRPLTQFDYERVSLGALRLLNESRDPGATEASVRTAAGIPDAESTTPTEVSGEDLVNDSVDVANRYNELMRQHNALIDNINQQQERLKSFLNGKK